MSTSSRIPRTFPTLLEGAEASLKDVADLIKDEKVKKMIIMAGAGISCAAGIPDFRSPLTGLYENLEKYKLPYPEAIFDIEYFIEKPQAFYTLASELYPGNFKPTLTHYFFRLLSEKGLLSAVFTQNIDTLERIAGLPQEVVIEAHGSFAEAECLNCKRVYTKESIKPQIDLGEVVRCQRLGCFGKSGALIKPKIVFFGEALSEEFHERVSDFKTCDLLIVLGTSLSVQPFASLIDRVPSTCPRLLINMETVGESTPRRFKGALYPSSSRLPSKGQKRPSASSPAEGDYNYSSLEEEEDEDEEEQVEGFDFDGRTGRKRGIRDVRYLGNCDEGVEKLSQLLGWSEELKELIESEHRRLDEEKKGEEVRDEGNVEVKEVEVVKGLKIVSVVQVENIEAGREDEELVELVQGLDLETKSNALL